MDLLFTQPLQLVAIGALATVTVFLYREVKAERKEKDDIQNQRLIDAKETRAALIEPLEKQANLSEKIYDFLINSKRGR